MNDEELPKNKFEIGDVVRLKDGDGRPHQISELWWTWSVRHNRGGWWEYRFADSGPRESMGEYNLAPFIDKRLVERACKILEDNITPVDDEFAVLCNNEGLFSKEQFIKMFKEILTQNDN